MGARWRDDEGEPASGEPTDREPGASSIWREDEGAPQNSTPEPGSTVAPDLWREDEGAPIAPAFHTVEPSTEPSIEPSAETETKTKRSLFRRPSTYAAMLLLLMFLGLVGDAGYAVARLSSSLPEVEEDLRAGRRALEAGDLESARALIESASENAAIATGAAGRPSIRVAEILPVIGADAEGLAALVTAAGFTTDGALAAVDAAEALGLEGESFAQGIYEGGQVDLDALEEAQPHFENAADSLIRASETLSLEAQPNIGRLRDALATARDETKNAAASAANGSALLSALPGLLGAEGERQYLLAFQALGEARGTGGVVGIYGVLSAVDGRLSLGKIAPYQDIQRELTEPVDAPGWFARSYAPQSAREEWAQANLTPNFPAAAEVMLNMYEAATGTSLDGAIAMDPITLSHFMAATGPIADPVSAELVTAENVSDLLLSDSYTRFSDPAAQNEFLGGLVRNFWAKIQSGDVGPEAAAAVGETVSNGHLKVYSTDSEEQAAMVVLGADGNYASLGPATQLVFNNNYAVNKVDYFLYRTVDTTVEMMDEGGASFTTRITVENRAPSEPASLLIGEGTTELPSGTNRMVLAAALPRGAQVKRTIRDGETLFPFTYRDSGHPVVWDIVTVPPGGTEEVAFVYSIEGPPLGTVGRLELTLAPQTTVNPDRFSFELIPPTGAKVTAASGAEVRGGRAYADGDLIGPRLMTFVLRAT